MVVNTDTGLVGLELPSPEQILEYKKEFGMTDETLKNDIITLREWLKKQPHLPNIEDDGRLERFLFNCKNSLEKCKIEIEKHYTIRSQYPEFFVMRDPLDTRIVNMGKVSAYVPLPKLTESGKRVVIFRLFDSDFSNFNSEAYCTHTFMTYDFRLSHDYARNDILVYDLSNVSLSGWMGAMPLPQSKKFAYIATAAFPFRVSAGVVYNSHKLLEGTISVCKTFLPKKLTSRVLTIRGEDELQKIIPKSILPADYGGDEKLTLAEMRDQWNEGLVKHRDWFIKEQSIKADESKRVGKPSQQRDEFEGSFRKICLD